MLIAAQCPHATHVAGYRKWQQLGRQVGKGELCSVEDNSPYAPSALM